MLLESHRVYGVAYSPFPEKKDVTFGCLEGNNQKGFMEGIVLARAWGNGLNFMGRDCRENILGGKTSICKGTEIEWCRVSFWKCHPAGHGEV